MDQFRKKLQIRWSDMDPNFHMRHSVYYDFGATLRMEFLMSHGVTPQLMIKQGFGPILFREEAIFKREIFMGDDLVMDVLATNFSEDFSRFGMQHNIFRGEEICATINVDGAFIDTVRRKLTAPPQIVIDMANNMPKAEGFRMI